MDAPILRQPGNWLADGKPLPSVPAESADKAPDSTMFRRPPLDTTEKEDAVEALKSMVFWPVAYPSIRDFWALVSVMCFAMVSYRLVILVLAAAHLISVLARQPQYMPLQLTRW